MNNNDFSLVLNRISLAITLLYLGFLFILTTLSSSDPTDRFAAVFALAILFPHLIALVIATILNIFISLEKSVNQMLIGITLIFYIIAGLLGTIMIFSISVQVILLSISIYKFK